MSYWKNPENKDQNSGPNPVFCFHDQSVTYQNILGWSHVIHCLDNGKQGFVPRCVNKADGSRRYGSVVHGTTTVQFREALDEAFEMLKELKAEKTPA